MRDPDDILIELLSEPQPEDPYPLYHALRAAAPNHPTLRGRALVRRFSAALRPTPFCSIDMVLRVASAQSNARP